MYATHNFTESVLFTSEIPYSNLSFDIEYVVEADITVDRAEGTVEGFEIKKCAVQVGAYDDSKNVLFSEWKSLDPKDISPKTFSTIEASICQLFFDALEKGGGDGEYESAEFPIQ